MENFFVISVVGNAAMLGLGILVGRYVERVRWNDLINDGILPKPRKG